MPTEFTVKDCSLIGIPTGRQARTLRELALHLQEVHVGSIYHHFWGGKLHSSFDEPEFQNDFAGWVRHSIHDNALSEKLGILDPTTYDDMESLRTEMLNILDDRLESLSSPGWTTAEQPFSFVRSQIVIYGTNLSILTPLALAETAPHFTLGSVFYHFVDARRRTASGMDDFRAWLDTFGEEYQTLSSRLAAIDPYFCTLAELKSKLIAVFKEGLNGKQ